MTAQGRALTAAVRVEERHDPAPRVLGLGCRMMNACKAFDDVKRRRRLPLVHEAVANALILLDVACDAACRQCVLELGGGTGQQAVLGAVARDDRAGPRRHTGRRRERAVVGRGRVEHAAVGEQQTEPAAHAEPGQTDLSGRPVIVLQALRSGDDVVDRRPFPGRK
jgi:hypothetical protein